MALLAATPVAPFTGVVAVTEGAASFTASLNVMLRSAFGAAPPPFVGVVAVTLGGTSTVNANTWFADIVSGGSLASWSATCAANTVVVQSSPLAKSTLGLIVNVV